MAGERSDLGKIFITDGGIYDANTTYEKLTMVSYNNSTYITLRTVTGVTPSNDRINYGLMAQGFTATYLSSVTAEDVQGLVVEAGSETPAQSLINAIADRVANQLVSNSDLQDILSDYILKSAIANNLSITEEGKVLDARQGKALNDALGTTNSNVSGVSNRVTPLESKSQQSTVVGPGGSAVTITASSMYTVGNLVMLQARISVTSAVSDAINFPLFNIPSSVAPYLPVSSRVPGLVSFHNNGSTDGTFTSLCEIRSAGSSNPNKYMYQGITSSLAAGAAIDVLLFFAKA